ncbi:MAG: hypothetical protein ABI675_03030 [Chitinophagaceae bacterium]
MIISAVNTDKLSKELLAEVATGNHWGVYDQNMHYSESEDIRFFKSKEDAVGYRQDNIDDRSQFKIIAIEPMLTTLRGVLARDMHRNDTDYYVIDDLSFAVSTVLKVNPDQNPLYDPDGNEFTDAVISHFESEEKNNVPQLVASPSMEAIRQNFDEIRKQLENQGYEPEFFLTLEASMKRGAPKHEERSYDELGGELIAYDHLFTRNDEGYYSLNKVTGTLYTYFEIDHATIKGIDTKDLETEMVSVNWEVDAYLYIKKYEEWFRKVDDDQYGRLVAVQLFNNNVPPWFDKPAFVSAIENELLIYPKMDFPGDTTASDLYAALKSYQQIGTVISQYSIHEAWDIKCKAEMVEQLVKGQPCSVVIPSGPQQGDAVVIKWDAQSKDISFLSNDQDVVQYFEKKPSELYNRILQELEEYPFQQLGNPVKSTKIIEGLLAGNKLPVHLEKEIIPAEHIDSYVLIERRYPDDDGLYFKPSELFRDAKLDMALQEMRNMGENFNYDESKANFALLVVGQYAGKMLQYDSNEMPSINSGFHVASMFNFSPYGNVFSMQASLNLTNRISEQVFVQRDIETNKLIFSNKHGEAIEIDKDFWTSKVQQILDKKQRGADEDLLTKRRISSDKGLNR